MYLTKFESYIFYYFFDKGYYKSIMILYPIYSIKLNFDTCIGSPYPAPINYTTAHNDKLEEKYL